MGDGVVSPLHPVGRRSHQVVMYTHVYNIQYIYIYIYI